MALSLTGKLRSAYRIPERKSLKTGEVFAARSQIQIETEDDTGRVALHTLGVKDHASFEARVGSEVTVPVRAYVAGGAIGFQALV